MFKCKWKQVWWLQLEWEKIRHNDINLSHTAYKEHDCFKDSERTRNKATWTKDPKDYVHSVKWLMELTIFYYYCIWKTKREILIYLVDYSIKIIIDFCQCHIFWKKKIYRWDYTQSQSHGANWKWPSLMTFIDIFLGMIMGKQISIREEICTPLPG